MAGRGFGLDRATQAWVRATGRRIDLNDHPWLHGPTGDPERVGEDWIEREAQRLGGELRSGGGLLGSMSQLAGADFEPALLAPPIVAFYEQTTDWRLDVWSEWSPPALPFAWLLQVAFSRRLDQLSMPLRPRDVAGGIDSRIERVVGADGQQLGAAWLRTLRSTGRTMYSGWYTVATLPGSSRPSIKVAFPLPNGSVTVFLRPDSGLEGSLNLASPLGAFGGDGAYLTVSDGNSQAWARRIPLAEVFRVYCDREGALRTDHALELLRVPALRLHYRLEPRG